MQAMPEVTTGWTHIFASKDFIPFPKTALECDKISNKQKHLLMYMLACCGAYDNCRRSLEHLGKVVFSGEPNPIGKVKYATRDLEKEGYLQIGGATQSTGWCFDYYPFPSAGLVAEVTETRISPMSPSGRPIAEVTETRVSQTGPIAEVDGTLLTRLIRSEDCVPIPRKALLNGLRTDVVFIYIEVLSRCRYVEWCRFIPSEIAELLYPGDYRSLRGVRSIVERAIKTLERKGLVRKEIRLDRENNHEYTWLSPCVRRPPGGCAEALRRPKTPKNDFFNYSTFKSESDFMKWSNTFSDWIRENKAKPSSYPYLVKNPLADRPNDHYSFSSKEKNSNTNTVENLKSEEKTFEELTESASPTRQSTTSTEVSASPPLFRENSGFTAKGERGVGSEIGLGDLPRLGDDNEFNQEEIKELRKEIKDLKDIIKDLQQRKDIDIEDLKDIVKDMVKDIRKDKDMDKYKDIIKDKDRREDFLPTLLHKEDKDIDMPKIEDWEDEVKVVKQSESTKSASAPIEIRKASEGPDPAAREKALARRVQTLSQKAQKLAGTGMKAVQASSVSPSQAAKLLQAEFDLLCEQRGYPPVPSSPRLVKQWKDWFGQQKSLEEALGYLRWFIEEWGSISNGPLAFTKAMYPTPIAVMSESFRQTLHSQGFIYKEREVNNVEKVDKPVSPAMLIVEVNREIKPNDQEKDKEEVLRYYHSIEDGLRQKIGMDILRSGRILVKMSVKDLREIVERERNGKSTGV